ncbi:unnamed protein product [Heterosigma akashiwo]
MLTRRPFFQGRTPQHQLGVIVQRLGAPSDADVAFVEHHVARQTIQAAGGGAAAAGETSWRGHQPAGRRLGGEDAAVQPGRLAGVEEALAHPYLAELHAQMDEPECQNGLFDFDFEHEYANGEIPLSDLQAMMYEEMLKCRPTEEEEISSKLAESKISGK